MQSDTEFRDALLTAIEKAIKRKGPGGLFCVEEIPDAILPLVRSWVAEISTECARRCMTKAVEAERAGQHHLTDVILQAVREEMREEAAAPRTKEK